jgi:hypothetical protein
MATSLVVAVEKRGQGCGGWHGYRGGSGRETTPTSSEPRLLPSSSLARDILGGIRSSTRRGFEIAGPTMRQVPQSLCLRVYSLLGQCRSPCWLTNLQVGVPSCRQDPMTASHHLHCPVWAEGFEPRRMAAISGTQPSIRSIRRIVHTILSPAVTPLLSSVVTVRGWCPTTTLTPDRPSGGSVHVRWAAAALRILQLGFSSHGNLIVTPLRPERGRTDAATNHLHLFTPDRRRGRSRGAAGLRLDPKRKQLRPKATRVWQCPHPSSCTTCHGNNTSCGGRDGIDIHLRVTSRQGCRHLPIVYHFPGTVFSTPTSGVVDR